jgi:hypothetical protein
MNDLYGEYGDLDEDLRKWFGRKGAPGKKKGWVDCNTCRKDKKTGKKKCSACGRSSGEKRSKYPSCRPTPSACGKRGKWGKKSKAGKSGGKSKKNEEFYMDLEQIIGEELEAVLDEKKKRKKKKKKKSGKKDACYHKVKSRYKVWPSAYASGALVKCRKVGAKNWGNSKKEHLEIMIEDELVQVLEENLNERCQKGYKTHPKRKTKKMYGKTYRNCIKAEGLEEEKSDLKAKVIKALRDEGGAAGIDALKDHTGASKEEIDKVVASSDNIKVHKDGDIILMDSLEEQLIFEELENYLEEALYYGLIEEEEELDEAKKKKKKACKPSKGKKFARRVKGKCVSYGQAGKAKGGGARIKPGTSKGNAYCARSYGDMKSHGKDCSGKDRGTPLCLSRQKWKCSGKYSRKGK